MSRILLMCACSLAACTEYQTIRIDGEDPDVLTLPRASFGDATSFEMRRALGTIDGTLRDVLQTVTEHADADATILIQPEASSALPALGCPALVVTGDLGWYHAEDCAPDPLSAYDGDLYVENVLELDLDRYSRLAAGALDHERLGSILFSDWTRDTANSSIVVDGQIWWTRNIFQGPYQRVDRYRIERSFGDLGFRESVSVELSCERYMVQVDLCDYQSGSEAAVSGLGSYQITGLLRRERDNLYGSVELRGEDTVRFEFDATIAGCVPYELSDGTTGEVCS